MEDAGHQHLQEYPAVSTVVLQEQCLPQTKFTHSFLKSILTSIDSNDPVVASAWLETLLEVIDLLPNDVIQDEEDKSAYSRTILDETANLYRSGKLKCNKKIFKLALAKAESDDISYRLTACHLVGKICRRFESYHLQVQIVALVQSLCQDASEEIRSCICSQLMAVISSIDPHVTRRHILPELVNLCCDEEIVVRCAAINSLVEIIYCLDDADRVGTMVPLVCKIYEKCRRVKDAALPVCVHWLGCICQQLNDHFSNEQKNWFIDLYFSFSTLGLVTDVNKLELPMPDLVSEVWNSEVEVECRIQCALNLPQFIVFMGIESVVWHSILTSFVSDPSDQVRLALAQHFHKLCNLVGARVVILRENLVDLLRCHNVTVVTPLVTHLADIVACMRKHRAILPHSQELSELLNSLLQCEESVSVAGNWRLHAESLSQVAALAPLLPENVLFRQLVPLMVVRMHSVRAIPCRLAAGHTLLVLLGHVRSPEQQCDISHILITEFCHGMSCHKRMLFIGICEMILQLFENSFFKSHFFDPLLQMHSDRVANIRLKLVRIFPKMKSTLILPQDKDKLQNLETSIGRLLMNENDRDVSFALNICISQLHLIDVVETTITDEQPVSCDGKFSIYKKSQEFESPGNVCAGATIAVPIMNASGSWDSIGDKFFVTAAERCKSGSYVVKPLDEQDLKRVATFDPSADEFLIDAGVRMLESALVSNVASTVTNPAVWTCHKVTQVAESATNPVVVTNDKVANVRGSFRSRLRPPSVVALASMPETAVHEHESTSAISKGRPKRNVARYSLIGSSAANVSSSFRVCAPSTTEPCAQSCSNTRLKSQSHENLSTQTQMNNTIAGDTMKTSQTRLPKLNRYSLSYVNASRHETIDEKTIVSTVSSPSASFTPSTCERQPILSRGSILRSSLPTLRWHRSLNVKSRSPSSITAPFPASLTALSSPSITTTSSLHVKSLSPVTAFPPSSTTGDMKLISPSRLPVPTTLLNSKEKVVQNEPLKLRRK